MIYTHRADYTERLVTLVEQSIPDKAEADKLIRAIYREEHLAKLERQK